MKVTKEFLKEKGACRDVLIWWVENCEGLETINQIKKLAAHRFDWANWLIVRVMTYEQYVSYAVFPTEQVLDIYEKRYTEDKRPRRAIEAAKICIKNPSAHNKKAAASAADAASDAANAADAAAYAAAVAASSSATAVDAAAYAATHAYEATYVAAAYDDDALKKIQQKIIEYGINLIS